MRQSLLVVLLGGASGIGGALATSSVQREPLPATAPESLSPLVIAPPGWDPRLVARVSHIEQQLVDSHANAVEKGPETTSVGEPSSREQERVEHYQRELEHRQERLWAHEKESIDVSWAAPQARSIEDALAPALRVKDARVDNVDCRSATCVATLSFPSPEAALRALSQGSELASAGCPGLSAVPTPPTAEGRYALTLIYACR